MSVKKRVAIIGAGWAGMAAAVELADRGCHVDVFEASRTLGGRARSLQWNGLTIDNGQHILVGAYTETLRLMRKVGVDPDKALLRMPLTLHYPGEFRMVAPKLPAPFHTALALLTAHGLDWREKFAAIRLMRQLQRDNYRIDPDITVSEWLDLHNVPPRQRTYLWDSLCISALNTPSERASAQIMANVLRDSLGGPREASDMLIPRIGMSELFPEPAARFVEAHGGQIHRGQRVSRISAANGGWLIDGDNAVDIVIIAVAPYHLADLLPELSSHANEPAYKPTNEPAYEPIVTTYLRYPAITLPTPMYGLTQGTAQWFFDRQRICGQRGVVAAVISAKGRHLDLPTQTLEATIHQELSRVVSPLSAPEATLTITEKRATFACTPKIRRPPAQLAHQLWLASDYVASDYPATLEGAVRSGSACAASLTE